MIALGAGTVIAAGAVWSGLATNPPVNPAHTLDANLQIPAGVSATLHRACYDCHSNTTRWPWYSQIPPASWLVHNDVNHARSMMNFSEWSEGVGKTPESGAAFLIQVCEAVKTGEMPKPRYLMLHPEARLSPDEVQSLCAWSKAEGKQLMARGENRSN